MTFTEENYIKAIYFLQTRSQTGDVSANEIAQRLENRPATVTDMLRKLSEKQLIHYEKYKRIHLTEKGKKKALSVIRKHRLWETFLSEKLSFDWDEVHDVAEQLEHIDSPKLIEKLDEFLGYPQFDPHGDPIPNAQGKIPQSFAQLLNLAPIGAWIQVVGVKDTSPDFLRRLAKDDLDIGSRLRVKEKLPFDHSLVIEMASGKTIQLSEKIASNLMVT